MSWPPKVWAQGMNAESGFSYRQLRKMEAATLVTSEWELQEDNRIPRRVYHIAAQGWAALDDCGRFMASLAGCAQRFEAGLQDTTRPP